MVDLHPEVIARLRARFRIGRELGDAAIAVDDHIARAFEIAPIDLHIAGDHKPCAALRPGTIKTLMANRGAVATVGQPLGKGGLAEPIGNDCPARQ